MDALSLDAFPDLLTPEHLSAILSMTPQTVRRYLRSGELPGAVHIGTRWYLPKKRLKSLIEGENGASSCNNG